MKLRKFCLQKTMIEKKKITYNETEEERYS